MDAIDIAKISMALKALSILLAEASGTPTLSNYGSEFYRGISALLDALAEKCRQIAFMEVSD